MFLAVMQTVVLTGHYLLIGVGTPSAPTPAAAARAFPRLARARSGWSDHNAGFCQDDARYDKARTSGDRTKEMNVSHTTQLLL